MAKVAGKQNDAVVERANQIVVTAQSIRATMPSELVRASQHTDPFPSMTELECHSDRPNFAGAWVSFLISQRASPESFAKFVAHLRACKERKAILDDDEVMLPTFDHLCIEMAERLTERAGKAIANYLAQEKTSPIEGWEKQLCDATGHPKLLPCWAHFMIALTAARDSISYLPLQPIDRREVHHERLNFGSWLCEVHMDLKRLRAIAQLTEQSLPQADRLPDHDRPLDQSWRTRAARVLWEADEHLRRRIDIPESEGKPPVIAGRILHQNEAYLELIKTLVQRASDLNDVLATHSDRFALTEPLPAANSDGLFWAKAFWYHQASKKYSTHGVGITVKELWRAGNRNLIKRRQARGTKGQWEYEFESVCGHFDTAETQLRAARDAGFRGKQKHRAKSKTK